MARQLQMLLIGDTTRPEFRDACDALDKAARVTRFADAAAAATELAESRLAPHGIVLVQSSPGQYAPADVDRLRSLAPLARIITLLGSWCEGEPRSGRPLPGVVRVYWHEAAGRFRQELPQWFDPKSVWALPHTATDEERLLASVGERSVPDTFDEGLVVIWTRHRAMAELLADACHKAGYASAWLHPRSPGRVQGAMAAIYDGDMFDPTAVDEISRLRASISPGRVIVLLYAPRTQDLRLAKSLGAEILAKPFQVDELLCSLAQRREGAKAQRTA